MTEAVPPARPLLPAEPLRGRRDGRSVPAATGRPVRPLGSVRFAPQARAGER